MTKADVISIIATETGRDKEIISDILEAMFKAIKGNLTEGRPVYIRGFASFIIKRRASKIGRNISKNTSLEIAEHYIPFFKASKEFKNMLRTIFPKK